MKTERLRKNRKTEGLRSLPLALWLAMGGMLATTPESPAAEPARTLPARAVVRFAGTSTLHDFAGQLPAQPFILSLSNGTWSADADVLAGQMGTANGKRDRKMHQMLGTNSFPRIQGSVIGAAIPGPAGTNVTLRLKIRDRTRELPVRIASWTETEREITFHAGWDLSLDDYGLKPPSVAGVIRVGDRVKLEAEVTATKPVPALPVVPSTNP